MQGSVCLQPQPPADNKKVSVKNHVSLPHRSSVTGNKVKLTAQFGAARLGPGPAGLVLPSPALRPAQRGVCPAALTSHSQ